MDSKIHKMRDRLAKQRLKIAEQEAIAAEMEKEIKKAEEEQLGHLARHAASVLPGGMDEVLELLRGLRSKPDIPAKPAYTQNSNEIKEGVTVEETDETEETEV